VGRHAWRGAYELTILKLNEPIEAYGEKLHELTLRAPTGKDIRKAGVPFRSWSDENGTTYNGADPAAIAGLLALMANIPPSAVDQLSAPDWLEAMTVVTSFFSRADGAQESTSDTGISPGSGASIRIAS
jgi:Phage tail assembly chaperone proteins, E, or 41 or 14